MIGVQSTCSNCGQKATADSFVMSLELKKMVCPLCAKKLKSQPTKKESMVKNEYKSRFATPFKPGSKFSQEKASVVKKKDDIFDDDDFLFEKKQKPKATPATGSYRCPSCSYLFKKSATVGKVYVKCPFCKAPLNG